MNRKLEKGLEPANKAYGIEVSTRRGFTDARGTRLLQDIKNLGIPGIAAVAVADLYFLVGELESAAVQRLIDELLHDPVVESAAWQPLAARPSSPPVPGAWTVEVTRLPGVTDSVAESLQQGARLIGIEGLRQAATGRRFLLHGDLSRAQADRIAGGLLANEVIETYCIDEPAQPSFIAEPAAAGDESAPATVIIPLSGADDALLLAISRDRRLSLDLAEMQAIRAYYRREGREPTDVELETLAQTWSEHCVHKTFKAVIDYVDFSAGSPRRETVDGLLNTYIRAATRRAAKPWVRSAFVDNAGIVAFDERYDLAFKVETHNHPSALEPFGGANTGVGGVVRDVIGVSARPIANTDILCFGPQTMAFDDLPAGVLHPRRIQAGVVAGIEDYGNKMGIPTVNGAILYDPGFTANPLVFCGCLGMLPHNAHPTEPQAGDLIVVLGGRTGRDGLRGATFSSMEMDHQTGEIAGSAVQIGHPIHEKQFLEAIIQARDEGLYTAITDCGAGGLSSAVGEMAEELGAVVHLERAPLKYRGLRPWEIWLSEAQERMVLAVPAANWPRLQAICVGLDVEATVLGEFSGRGRLDIRYHDRTVGDLDCDFLHNGIPRRQLLAEWRPPQPSTSSDRWPVPDLTDALLALLAMPETRSKEDVVRQYDHEVQGGTVCKPFVGVRNHGPGDGTVLVPLDTLRAAHLARPGPQRGLALAVGVNPAYGALDPYHMAWACIDEAIRNVVAVGADPDQISLLDNFAWGNPNLPDRLGSLVRCCQGCYDAAVAFAAPFISGKDSLNNEYTGADGQKHAIPGTLVISALGIVPDVDRTSTMDLKRPGNLIYAVGRTAGEMGGSGYARRFGLPADGHEPAAPQPPAHPLDRYRALHRAIADGLVRACHDCSEGGLAVAAAEMALAGGWGIDLHLGRLPGAEELASDRVAAFCESLGRFLVEIAPEDAAAFESTMAGHPVAPVGQVREAGTVRVFGLAGQLIIDVGLEAVEQAWAGHLAGVTA